MSSVLINIDVPNLVQAERFYRAAFELTVGRRFGDDGVELLGLGCPIYLLEKLEGSKAYDSSVIGRNYQRHWTPIHIDIVVDDIDSALEQARLAGAIVEQPIVTAKWGKIALLSDPFGHGFCLLQFIGQGYDEISN